MKPMTSLGAIALACLAAPSWAQSAKSIDAPAAFAPLVAPCARASDGSCAAIASDNPLPVDTVIRLTAADRGAIVTTAGTAQQLMAANASRRGFAIQNQSTGACYINGQASATQDYRSLLIPAGGFYDTPPTHVGTGAISIVCAVANAPVYAREW